jgi:hypothetical protein
MEPVTGLIKIYCTSHYRDARLFVQQPPIEKRFILVGTDLEKLVPDFLMRPNEHVPVFVCRHVIETLEQFEMDTFTKLCDAYNEEQDFSTSTTIYLTQE